MADLNEQQAAQTVKLTGVSSSGVETNYIDATANNELKTADISNNGGTQGALTISTTAVEIKVGGSPLANRKAVTVYNNSTATLYWGYTSGVTTSSGTPLVRGQFGVWALGPNTSLYFIASSAGNNIRITENA